MTPKDLLDALFLWLKTDGLRLALTLGLLAVSFRLIDRLSRRILVRGIEHFRTPLATGLAIMRHLRENLSGPAIPNFCLDPPGAGGKIELAPESVVERRPGETVLRAGGGALFRYPDPVA